jgi:hypothetical protein
MLLDVKCEVAAHHGLGRPRLRREAPLRQIGDLSRTQRARRDLAQNLGNDVERAHLITFQCLPT